MVLAIINFSCADTPFILLVCPLKKCLAALLLILFRGMRAHHEEPSSHCIFFCSSCVTSCTAIFCRFGATVFPCKSLKCIAGRRECVCENMRTGLSRERRKGVSPSGVIESAFYASCQVTASGTICGRQRDGARCLPMSGFSEGALACTRGGNKISCKLPAVFS